MTPFCTNDAHPLAARENSKLLGARLVANVTPPRHGCINRPDTARHGAARHGTARHGADRDAAVLEGVTGVGFKHDWSVAAAAAADRQMVAKQALPPHRADDNHLLKYILTTRTGFSPGRRGRQ